MIFLILSIGHKILSIIGNCLKALSFSFADDILFLRDA